MKDIAANLALAVIFVGLTMLAAEAVLRFTPYNHYAKQYLIPVGYFQLDPELGVDHAPNRPSIEVVGKGPTHDIFTNSLGCFDKEHTVRPGYVLVVGDSHTWGFVALEYNWASVLEELTGRQILKCGVSGTGTRFQMVKAQKVIEKVGFPPSMIIVLHTNNDLNDDAVFPGYTLVDGHRVNTLKSLDLRTGELLRNTPQEIEAKYEYLTREGLKQFLLDHLITARLVRGGRDYLLRGPQSDVQDPVLIWRYQVALFDLDAGEFPWMKTMVESHLDNIRAFRDMAARHGSTFVLISRMKSGEGLRRHVKRTLPELVPLYHDLEPDMERAAEQAPLENTEPGGHWNPYGNRMAAESIHRFWVENGL
jgi:hypothetical protein